MLVRMIKTIQRWQAERRAIEALTQLTDHQLNDIGVSRGSLEQAIRHGL